MAIMRQPSGCFWPQCGRRDTLGPKIRAWISVSTNWCSCGWRKAPIARLGCIARRVTRSKSHARKPGMARRGHQRQAARPVLRPTKSGRQHHALQSARPGERRKGTRTTLTRQERRAKRPRSMLNRASSVRRAAPPVRHAKRREAIRTPRRQRGHTLQRSHTTRRHAGTTAGRRSPTRSHQE